MGLKTRRPAFERARLTACLVLVAASPCAAQTTLRSMHLEADLSADEAAAEVRIEYVLAVEGSPQLRFELLGFGGATTDKFWLGEPGMAPAIRLEPASGSLRAAEVTPAYSDPASELRLVVHYRIAQAVQRNGAGIRMHVPVLTLALPPKDGVTDLFTADLRLPDGWAISESFPSGLRATEDGRHAVELAVTPSVISVRARSDGGWRHVDDSKDQRSRLMSIPTLWGLFVACGAMVVAYVVWMLWEERR